MNDTGLELMILKGLTTTGSPIPGIALDFFYSDETQMWTVVCYSEELLRHPDEKRQAFMRWLFSKVEEANHYGVKSQLARQK